MGDDRGLKRERERVFFREERRQKKEKNDGDGGGGKKNKKKLKKKLKEKKLTMASASMLPLGLAALWPAHADGHLAAEPTTPNLKGLPAAS